MKNKNLQLVLTLCGGLFLSGCLGDVANQIAGTNGATLTATPSTVALVVPSYSTESSAVITIANTNPIDGAATNISPSFLAGVTGLVISNGCPSSLSQNARCTITVTGNSASLILSTPLTINYNAGSAIGVPAIVQVSYTKQP